MGRGNNTRQNGRVYSRPFCFGATRHLREGTDEERKPGLFEPRIGGEQRANTGMKQIDATQQKSKR